jgi:small subunit ribosomal protein S8
MTDPLSDLLTRIRNAHRALLPSLDVPHSRMKEKIAAILKREGYIIDFSVENKAPRKNLTLKLKYEGKKGVIEGVRRVSKPGLRHYVGATEIPRVRGGLGTAILSTSHGVMTGVQARKNNLGGEVLCYVW